MEIRFQHFLLNALLGLVFAMSITPSVAETDVSPADEASVSGQPLDSEHPAPQSQSQSQSQQNERLRLEPNIQRIPFDPAKIDTEDFELGILAGLMSVEDFGVNSLMGVRAAYHVSEDFFLEAQYAITDTEPTSAEILSALQLLTDEQRELSYYTLSLGYNILPSEAYLGRKFAFRSSLYFLAGAGSTDFAGDKHFTISVGAGYRFLLNDWLAVHLDMQNNMFDLDLLGEEKTLQNLQFHVGLSSFF